jgi:hypothetical protein
MKIGDFWDTELCSLGADQRFGGVYLHHQSDCPDDDGSTHLKCRSTLSLQGAIFHKALIFILATMRT